MIVREADDNSTFLFHCRLPSKRVGRNCVTLAMTEPTLKEKTSMKQFNDPIQLLLDKIRHRPDKLDFDDFCRLTVALCAASKFVELYPAEVTKRYGTNGALRLRELTLMQKL